MPSFTVSRKNALVAAVLALVAVFVAAHFLTAPATGSPAANPGGAGDVPVLTTPTATTPTTPSEVVVDVAGAVRRPGVYRLPAGSRITDAIARAGGAARDANSSLVDLAAPLADGEQVLVPAMISGSTAATGSGSPGGGQSPTAPVDLNTATAEELDALPGVGPVTAQKIVDYRTQHGSFTSVDDLDAIPGIGPSRIDNLRGLVIP